MNDTISAILTSRRVGDPVDITNVILFLASEQASYVTGATWLVDGGHTVAAVSGTPAVASK